MYHMKRASVRDLRYDFPKVEKMLKRGETIEITKRNQVVARLVPAEGARKIEVPDFGARLKRIFGDRMLEPTGAELIRQDRDKRF